MAIIVRKLQKEIKKSEEELKFLVNEKVKDTDLQKIEVMNRLKGLGVLNSYVYDFEWVKRKETRIKIKDLVISNFNYTETSQKHGVSINSLQVTLSRANKNLKKKIQKPLDLILEGRVKEGIILFETGSLKETSGEEVKDKVFLDDFLLKLEGVPSRDRDYYLAEMVKALKFMKFYTHMFIANNITSVEGKHLSFLRSILENDDPQYAYQRQLILSFFNGDLSIQEIVQDEQKTLQQLKELED